ncbi:Rieske 2Fe-2S domain-containing protein [Variovorax boronicumulans]|uniref:Rieske 2Fe-2S domain-containing protein n=1 Tax=Variovorax boronicumulans TaxID=436515 RepID=UPI0036F2311B
MIQRIFLCKDMEILPDLPYRVCPVEREGAYLLYRIEGAIFMTDELCTHGQASLATGELHGYQIQCPLHGGAFDVRTGLATEFPCKRPIGAHRVELVEDSIFGWFE